jgi:hypothetical protein
MRRFVRIFGFWDPIKTLNSVQHLFEITGRLDDSTSVYNFEEQIKPVLHYVIKNKHAEFTFVAFAIFIIKFTF